MASVFLDSVMLRHGPRWHPMAKQVAALNPQHAHVNYHGGLLPSPMGVWGQKPSMIARSPQERMTSQQHRTNSWHTVASTPRPVSRRREVVPTAQKPAAPVHRDGRLEKLSLRPVLRRETQVPGRYFPKPSLTDQERVLLAAKTGRPLSGSFLLSNKFHEIKKLASKISHSAVSSAADKPTRPTSSCNQKIATTRRTLFEHNENVAKSEVFLISFRDDDGARYDPSSELHSDYYTVQRQVRFAPVRQVSVPAKEAEFVDVIRGQAKRMHSRG